MQSSDWTTYTSKSFFASLLVLFMLLPALSCAEKKPCNVLAVLSYHDAYEWQQDLKRGIVASIGDHCQIDFFNLDSLKSHDATQKRAAEAYDHYQKTLPDFVIAADDPAQSFFVVPYLLNKTVTPVVFCGVNGNVSDYGYPGRNTTGILERYHINQSLALLKKIRPASKTIAFVVGAHNVTGNAVIAQIRDEIRAAPLRVGEFSTPSTLEETLDAAVALGKRHDALYLDHFEGMCDASGTCYSQKDVMKKLISHIPQVPIVCGNDYAIRAGCFVAVMKTGFEQGQLAGKAVLALMQGKQIKDIPISQNVEGIRIVNLSAMKRLGVAPPGDALRGVKLIREE
jgi:ABC-type uncharacterized transport system substrate-binding protein